MQNYPTYKIDSLITGARIKRRYISYWISVPLNYFFSLNIPSFFLSFIVISYLLLGAAITYYLTQTILNVLFGDSYLTLPISQLFGLFILWRLDRSNEKLKLEVNGFRSDVANKYFDEYRIYRYFLHHSKIDDFNFSKTKTSNYNEMKIKNLNSLYAFKSYFIEAEKSTNLIINSNILIALFRIHFNTDYNTKGGLSTKEVHPFFKQLLIVFKKENGTFYY